MFAEIYASHIVEHLDYAGELQNALKEWNRILVPGGKISISVPDLDVLSKLMLERGEFSLDDRFQVMRMIFGGHLDKHDYHLVGLNEEFLTTFLGEAGYVRMRRVPEFGLFSDTSSFAFKGVPISLNMVAEKRTLDEAIGQLATRELGRNQACHCGSGKKFKHCHGRLG